jgi:uncharacterized protein (DUF1330 family)
MQVINQVRPIDPEHIKKMMEKGPDGAVFMINLLTFKDKAEYEDRRETTLTGRAAYAIYGKAVADILPKFGGRFFLAADVTFLALGQVEELWDEVAIAVYPERSAMLKMSMSEEWQAAGVHRAAGLAGQLNLETVVQDRFKTLPWMRRFLEELEI